MDLTRMHVLFRQFAQQMGMQNTRAILPEQIDALINTSISDSVNQVVRDNVSNTNDRVITDNSKIGQVNALRTLYTVLEVCLVGRAEQNGPRNGNTFKRTKRYIDKFTAKFSDLIGTDENSGQIVNLNDKMLILCDFAVSYADVKANGEKLNLCKLCDCFSHNVDFESNFFPIRLIDDIYLADALNDFTLQPVLRSPIATVHDMSVDVYYGRTKNDTFDNALVPYHFRIGYIRKPAVVKYYEDMNIPNVDCDMPEHMHVDIVKHAVELWQASVTNNIATEQARQQRAQQEAYRNANRNENI